MMFTQRTTKPTAGNKNYIRKSSGGWNTCVKGNPADKNCDVLANCVGYASGRFNEIYNELTGHTGHKYTTLNCNAEGFVNRAKAAGLEVGMTPRPGAIMVWQKGATLKGSDGAGHVAIVEKVLDNQTVYSSESSYGGKAFFNATRKNTNGKWGIGGSGYTFIGFVYNPAVPVIQITPIVERNIYKNQLKTIDVMNVRTGIETNSPSLGTVAKGSIFNYYDEVQGKSSKWYAITEDKTQWIAGINNDGHQYCEIMPAQTKPMEPKPEPQPVPTPQPQPKPIENNSLQVGDTVKIVGKGNGSSKGTSGTAYGIGWTREILKIWEGRPYPYQVGNHKGTTGFYKANALQKK